MDSNSLKYIYIFTKTVNFPVRSSLNNGSWFGCIFTKPSLFLVTSCCSYNDNALDTSNFLADKNFTAVLQETGSIRLLILVLLTVWMNSFVAWNKYRVKLSNLSKIVNIIYRFLYLYEFYWNEILFLKTNNIERKILNRENKLTRNLKTHLHVLDNCIKRFKRKVINIMKCTESLLVLVQQSK